MVWLAACIADGYSKRFGIVHVDFQTTRCYYKASALWLANIFGTSSARSARQALENANAWDAAGRASKPDKVTAAAGANSPGGAGVNGG